MGQWAAGLYQRQGPQTRKDDLRGCPLPCFLGIAISAWEPAIWGSPESAHKCFLILFLSPLYLAHETTKFLRKKNVFLKYSTFFATPPKQRASSDRILPCSHISSPQYHLDLSASYVGRTGVLSIVCDVCSIGQRFWPLGAYKLLMPYWEYLSPCLSPTSRQWAKTGTETSYSVLGSLLVFNINYAHNEYLLFKWVN